MSPGKCWFAASGLVPSGIKVEAMTGYRIEEIDDPHRAFIYSLVQADERPSPFIDGIIFDVTGRRRAESALHQREKDLALAQEIAHLGSWI